MTKSNCITANTSCSKNGDTTNRNFTIFIKFAFMMSNISIYAEVF